MIASCWERHLISRSNGNRSQTRDSLKVGLRIIQSQPVGNRHALQNCDKIWLVGGWTGVFFPRNFLPRQCFPDCPSWPMRQRMVMDSGGGLRVGSLLRLACASNSKPDVAIRCGMHGCWAQEVGKALIAKASSFNAKQAWVLNHMAELLPSLIESILYIQAFLDVCGWWQFEHIREVHFFSDASFVFLRNSCSRDVLVTGFCLIWFLWWNLDGTISWVLWALFTVHFLSFFRFGCEIIIPLMRHLGGTHRR